MQSADIMNKDVKCVRDTDTVQFAAKLMRDHNIGFLPVCDSDGRAIGTLTDRDIAVRIVSEDWAASRCQVSEAMSREVVAVRPQDDVHLAADLMARYQKSRIVVLDDDDVIKGVISLSDLAKKGDLEDGARTLREVAARETRPS